MGGRPLGSCGRDSLPLRRPQKPAPAVSKAPTALLLTPKETSGHYSGKFYVDGRLTTVLYHGRTKTTQLGGSDATVIASRLLSELLPEK